MTSSPQTRGNKGRMYEGGHRVPGIVWAPGHTTPGTSSELIMTMDIMPTSMALANIEPPAEHQLDGVNVAPALFDGKPLPHRTVFWGRSADQWALRDGPWKLVNAELYNLDADPRETKDLAGQYPEKVSKMSEQLRAMFENALSDSPYD